jgi:antitoxin ParD1/3/4
MNISLTPTLEEFIKQKVSSGFYHSASEVVREALRLLEERDRLREMRLDLLGKEIQVGIDQIERGEYTEYNEHTLRGFFEGVRIEGGKQLEAKRQTSG